jgi:hypothetical protein
MEIPFFYSIFRITQKLNSPVYAEKSCMVVPPEVYVNILKLVIPHCGNLSLNGGSMQQYRVGDFIIRTSTKKYLEKNIKLGGGNPETHNISKTLPRSICPQPECRLKLSIFPWAIVSKVR